MCENYILVYFYSYNDIFILFPDIVIFSKHIILALYKIFEFSLTKRKQFIPVRASNEFAFKFKFHLYCLFHICFL